MRFSPARLALAAVLGVGILSCNEALVAPIVGLDSSGKRLANDVAPDVVISQVYGGGGNSGATLKNDFIELLNRGSASVNLSGWSVQYQSANGTAAWFVTNLTGTLQPGQYYLVQEAAGTGGTQSLPPFDASGAIAMSATDGKVALVQSTTALTGGCPTTGRMDLVSYGTTACSPKSTPKLTNTTAALRKDFGCTNSSDPSVDFVTGIPSPRNTVAPLHPCSSVTVSPSAVSVLVGGTQTFTAIARDAAGNPISATFTWSSSNPTIATIDAASAVATGVAQGTTTITATSGALSGTASLRVNAPLPDIRISEIHYDNDGDDVGEAIEVEAPAGRLDNWKLVLYNGNDGKSYDTKTLSGWVIDRCNGRGVLTISYPRDGIQNGPQDAIALVDPNGAVVEFLSYEGTMTATEGVANGMTAIDIGVSEANTSPVGQSLQRNGVGEWAGPKASTFGACNENDVPPPPPPPIIITELMADPSRVAATFGEWFEVYNAGTTAVDMKDWIIVSTGQPNHTIAPPAGSSLVVPPGEFRVLGRDALITRNGGLHEDYNYFVGTANTIFLDATDELTLMLPTGQVVDDVRWQNTGTMAHGISRALRDFTVDNFDVDGANWGYTNVQYGDGDFGTPGAANGSLISTPPPLPNRITFSGRVPFVAGNNSTDPPLPVGFDAQIFATLVSGTGATLSTTFTWSSETPNIASVDANGVIHALAAGTAIFRATASDADHTTATYALPMIVPVSGSAPYGHNAEFGIPADGDASDDFVITRPQYTLSYSKIRNTPNWVSYEISDQDNGSEDRCNCFTFDPQLPPEFTRYTTNDYVGSLAFYGFQYDRGHLARSSDRTTGSLDNAATYYLSNVVPQAAAVNQGPWNFMEQFLGNLARNDHKEVYIITGVAGSRGLYRNVGPMLVPDKVWKVALVLPHGKGLSNVHSLSDVEQTIAVIMPNDPTVDPDWTHSKTTVDAVEALSGYDLLAMLPDDVEIPLEANDLPPVAHLNAPSSASEGAAVQFDAGASSDPDAGDAVQSYQFDFGDGSPIVRSANATSTHTYADNGSYTITLTVYDKVGAFSHTTINLSITNVAPSATFSPPASIPEGSSFTLALTGATDPSPIDATALLFAFDCGDGSYSTPSSLSNVSCPTSVNESRAVRAKVIDKDGAFREYTGSVEVTNVAPIIASFSGATLLPGETYSASSSFTDPGADVWNATVNYGDGSGTNALALSGKSFALSHTYQSAGNFTVTVGVNDGAVTSTQTAAVIVLAPLSVVQSLIQQVDDMSGLPGNSLHAKLDAAAKQIQAGKNTPAANQLSAFLNELDALVSSGRMSTTDAEPLRVAVNRVIRSLTRG